MRTTLFALGVALLAAACGGAASPGFGGDGGTGGGSSGGGSSSGGSSSGGSSSGGGGCGDTPGEGCVTGCNGEVTGPECVNGSWVCPPGVEIACSIDAGFGIDAAPKDSGTKLSGDGGIDCVTRICNAATQYCNITGGGVPLPDAGSNMSYSCLPLPTMPCDAGTGCACIPSACSCTDDGGYITNECLYP